MTIPRNLSILAEGASAAGVLAATNGGTGLTSPGTSGNVLTSNGTGWTSTAPGMTLIQTQTATGTQTSLPFTLPGGVYDTYFMTIFISDGSTLDTYGVQVDFGSGYITSSYAIYGVRNIGGAVSGFTSTTYESFRLCNTTSSSYLMGTAFLTCKKTSATNYRVGFNGAFYQQGPNGYFPVGYYASSSATPIVGIRLVSTSLTTSMYATVSLYGISS